MRRTVVGVLAGLVVLPAVPAAALAGPTVSVRVEGATATLLERTTVTLPDTPSGPCPAGTAGHALDAATGGNWDRAPFAQTVLGETHDFSGNDYWAEWIGNAEGYKPGSGLCNDVLAEGDEVLMLADVSGPAFAPTAIPVDVEAVPSTVRAGTSVTVTVVEYRSADLTPGQSTRTLLGGATVTAGPYVTTSGADGSATLRLDQPGTYVLKATRPGGPPSAGKLIVATAADAPAPPAGQPPAAPSELVPDTAAPTAAFTGGLRSGRTYRRARAPRELSGTVASDPSGLAALKLRIRRDRAGRCAYFSGSREAFKRARCGRAFWFRVPARTEWSYLLPRRLGKGRYVIEVAAVDGAGNRDETRAVIRVR